MTCCPVDKPVVWPPCFGTYGPRDRQCDGAASHPNWERTLPCGLRDRCMGLRAALGWSGLDRSDYLRSEDAGLVALGCHCRVDRVSLGGMRRWRVAHGREGRSEASEKPSKLDQQASVVRLVRSLVHGEVEVGKIQSIARGQVGILVAKDQSMGVLYSEPHTPRRTLRAMMRVFVRREGCMVRLVYPHAELGLSRHSSLGPSAFEPSLRMAYRYRTRVLTWAEMLILSRAIFRRFHQDYPEMRCLSYIIIKIISN